MITNPPGLAIEFGDLRRLEPISRSFGFDLGQPVDRYYIERFLARHAADISGRVAEMGDRHYTTAFGGTAVTTSDVVDVSPQNGDATILADLSDAPHLPPAIFDCFIFTQTMQYIYDLQAAVDTLYHVLKPGGVLLATFPAISQICREDMDRGGDFWRFTTASVWRLLADVFDPEQVEVAADGNVLAATAFLYGLPAEALQPGELDYQDPDYQLVITARAVKRAAGT
jgi:SAM-dependent methyltransferase